MKLSSQISISIFKTDLHLREGMLSNVKMRAQAIFNINTLKIMWADIRVVVGWMQKEQKQIICYSQTHKMKTKSKQNSFESYSELNESEAFKLQENSNDSLIIFNGKTTKSAEYMYIL